MMMPLILNSGTNVLGVHEAATVHVERVRKRMNLALGNGFDLICHRKALLMC